MMRGSWAEVDSLGNEDGELHRARRGVLLRVDGHRPLGRAPATTSRSPSRPGEPGHRFIAEPGTAEGAGAPGRCPRTAIRGRGKSRRPRPRSPRREHRMGREMPAVNLPALMRDSRESPHWQDVASRCLTCGNCTMVCPTCFCTTTEDVSDLTGDHAERWQRWASCFELDFSYVHGGERAAVRGEPVPAVDQPQARDLALPVRHIGLCGLRPVY